MLKEKNKTWVYASKRTILLSTSPPFFPKNIGMGKFTYLTDFQPPPPTKKKNLEKKHMETPAVGLQNAPIPTRHVETRQVFTT